MTTPLITAGLIVIKDKQLLLAFSNNKQAFYLPGGKSDPGETTVDTILREVFEELNIQLSPKNLQFYTHITAPHSANRPASLWNRTVIFQLYNTTRYPPQR